MSKLEGTVQEDFDFWEFVTCSRCLLPFNLDPSGAPSVPFWLTECGHVLCNHHIKPDRSCGKCGERDIQVTSLQSKVRFTTKLSANTVARFLPDGPTNVYLVYRGPPDIVRGGLLSIGTSYVILRRLYYVQSCQFQYNQLATLVRHYKRKCGQQRTIIEKMKADAQNYSEVQKCAFIST
ncbi:hypothetical protein BDY19DRAFT_918247 [Irpex rosettiformis]|uniref:Uncharacterized protein n=1 Tax=Irpex rosettiformis TaxID=378272 RepID=A0ACB8UH34_9APHY|nr:hypothetical protein BDY19DRAFT_918247 [Irpex rosettiformis]